MKVFKRFKNSYMGFVLKEMKYRLACKKSYERMAISMERYRNCKTKKSIKQIKSEIKLCKKYWKCYPLHYFRYDLYERDKQLTEKELLEYIPEFFFYKLFLTYYDSNKYATLVDEKNITEQIFRSVDINQPKTLYKLINNNLYKVGMENQSIDDFRKDLEVNKYNKIFVKPVGGQGGNGIFIFHRKADGSYKTKVEEHLNEEFLKKIGTKGDYIFQLAVSQDKRISEIYPNSVNTFRIATENKNGKARVICATLRVGKEGKEVDNGDQNGLVLGIDIDTGRIKEVAMTRKGGSFYKHPDTGFVFKDYEIPEWNRVKAFANESASKLAQFTYLGWDIALSEEGPLAIETNMGFGLDHFQASLGGLREAFSIDEPNFYWRNRR
jgi:hypothetical protein